MSSRMREVVSEPLPIDYFEKRRADGWILEAVEWTRQRAADLAGAEEPPYGQRIAADCSQLIDDPGEMRTLLLMYEKVVAGWRPGSIAAELNGRALRTRAGLPWSSAAVFDLLPRLIELSPKLQKHPEWPARRAALERVS